MCPHTVSDSPLIQFIPCGIPANIVVYSQKQGGETQESAGS